MAIDEGHCVLRHADRRLGTEELERRILLSASLAQVDGVVVVSDYMRSLLVEAEPGLAERVHLLARPIRDLGLPAARRRTCAGDPAVITFAGRITPEKGLAVLVEALGSAGGTGRVELRIAGVVEHQSYWSDCQRLQQRAVDDNPRLRVAYLGQLDYPAIDRLLRDSDIVAIPSQWPEPLGAVAIEAMSAGAAVVASDIGGLGTHLVDGQTGLLVEPADVAGWAGAIESLLDFPGRADHLGRRAHLLTRRLTPQAHLGAFDGIVRQLRSGGGIT